MLEPDAGSLTYLPLLVVSLFLSSLRMLVITALVLSVVMIPAAYMVGVKIGAIKNYQQERINVILDPEHADKRGFGYHTWQSILAIGEGGLTGERHTDYSESNLKFLPEPQTDFIFAVTSEHTGFIGAGLCLRVFTAFDAVDLRSEKLTRPGRNARHYGRWVDLLFRYSSTSVWLWECFRSSAYRCRS
jgi:rod shape determining protein RodA